MKHLLALLSFCVASLAAAQETEIYDVKIIRVIDGDTVVIEAPFVPHPLKPELSLRLIGIDTPEKAPRAKCSKEADLANRASLLTGQMVSSTTIHRAEFSGWDKFGGRILGKLSLDGVDVAQALIGAGLAKPYDGGKKSNWCEVK